MKKYLCLLSSLLVLAACHHHHDHEGHHHGEDLPPLISYTLQQGNIEAFVELLPPIVGQEQSIEIILSQLQPLQPLAAKVQVQVNKQTSIPLNSSSQGVYSTALLPQDTLPQQLTFWVATDSQQLQFELPPLPVATTAANAKQTIYPQKDKVGNIAFGPAQMWNSDFVLSQAQQRAIGQIIHTSGSIEPANSNLITMVAGRDGVVSLRKKNLTSGTAVQAGELLFSVAGRGIVSDNLEMNFVKAQSNLKRQEANIGRKRQLLAEQIIGQKEFDESLNDYQVAEAEYNNIKKVFSKGSRRHLVTAPTKGFLAQVGVHEGEFVQAGQQLATLLQTNRLQVRVDVSPRYGSLLPLVVDANFINPYSNKAYSLASLEGSILSFGKMTSHEEGHYLPLYFEINNHPDLLPGTLIEVYLSTKANTSQLCIPKSAVLEEMGSQVVFVRRSGGSYDKQVVQLGATDGNYVEVLHGLSEGDYVVSQGALRIKVASMTGTVDPHAGHNH
jgi:RND family efflux transporter MFP subunit